MAPVLYSNSIITSGGTLTLANVATTSSVAAQIAAVGPDVSKSTTAWTAAVSGTPTNATSGNITVGTVQSFDSAANKNARLIIPFSVAPTAVAQTSFTITLTGTAFTSILLAKIDNMYSGISDPVVAPLIIPGSSNTYTIYFGANVTTAHQGVITIEGLHA